MRVLTLAVMGLIGCAPTSPPPTTAPQASRSEDAATLSIRQRGASGFDGLLNRAVKVHFRRDALGYSGQVTLEPTLEQSAGRVIAIEGTIRSIEQDWIILERTNGQINALRAEAILLIEVKP